MATVVKTVPQPVLPRMAPREDLNPFRIAQIQFDMAAEYLKLDPGLRQILRTPKRVMEVSDPREDGQRADESVHRFSRAAQCGARPGQRRASLSSGRHARRSESAGRVDDLEDGHGQPPVRRRQGRRHLRSQAHVQGRTRTHDAPVRRGNSADHRPRGRYSRARRLHRRANHGVDHGHVCDDRGPRLARRRDRQARFHRRLRRAQRRHRARMPLSWSRKPARSKRFPCAARRSPFRDSAM